MKNIIFTLILFISAVSFGQTAEEYFNSGLAKYELKDYSRAISDYTKAIELTPASNAYFNRGLAKKKLEDYYGAISDYNKSIATIVSVVGL